MNQVLLLTVVRALVAGAAIVAALLAANVFGQEDFGIISLAWSLATVGSYVIDAGTATSIRKYGMQSMTAAIGLKGLLGPVLMRFLIALVVAASAMVGLSLSLPMSYAIIVTGLAAAFAIEIIISDAFRFELRNVLADYLNGGIRNSLYLAGVLAAFWTDFGPYTLLAMLLASMAFVCTALMWAAYSQSGSQSMQELPASEIQRARESRRFFGVAFLMMLSAQLPVLMAGFLGGAGDAAQVRVAVLFGAAMLFLNSAFTMYFAPRLARADQGQLGQILRSSARLGGAVFLVGGLLVALIPTIVSLAFDEIYQESIIGAQILVGAISIISLFGAYNQMLLMTGNEKFPLQAAIAAPIITSAVPLAAGPNASIGAYCLGYAAALVLGQLYVAFVGCRRLALTPWAAGSKSNDWK